MAPKLVDGFEDSLLIIKPDYMHKKKHVLLFLNTLGYQLQGRRLVSFTPEHAAEFYKDGADEKWFMLQVILLSKGNSEAFIFAKDNCVEDLYNTMICYFRSSNEMDRFVHVTQRRDQVRHEITFIFPNYIYEPIPYFDKTKFCKQDYVGELIGEIYEIVERKDPSVDWKEALAKHLLESNPNMPKVVNECSQYPTTHTIDTHVQTSYIKLSDLAAVAPESAKSSISLPCASSSRSSRLLSTSSCISCGKFSSDQVVPCQDVICGRITPIDLTPRASEHVVIEEAEVEVVHEAELGEFVPETYDMETALSKEADDFFMQGMPSTDHYQDQDQAADQDQDQGQEYTAKPDEAPTDTVDDQAPKETAEEAPAPPAEAPPPSEPAAPAEAIDFELKKDSDTNLAHQAEQDKPPEGAAEAAEDHVTEKHPGLDAVQDDGPRNQEEGDH